MNLGILTLVCREIITVKSLKSKKWSWALSLFYYVSREMWLATQESLFAQTNQDFAFSHTRQNSKMFNISSKYFSFFNNKPPARWATHTRRDILTCYSCSHYSSMVRTNIITRSVKLRENTNFLVVNHKKYGIRCKNKENLFHAIWR